MKRKVQFLTSILLTAFFIQGCGDRPPAPVSTPDSTEATIMEDLYNISNDPASTNQVLTLLQERTPESQKTIIGLFTDGFLQRRGFGLGPERMELLKSLLVMYAAGIDVDEVLGISREFPEQGGAQFAYLPERTIVVIANEITTIWDSDNSIKFANELSSVFEQSGIEPDTINALVRSMEIRDFMNRLEHANSGAIPAQSQAQDLTTYNDPDLGISFEYPTEWKEEELQDGIGVRNPIGTTTFVIKQLDLEERPSELIAEFTESAKGSNPYLVYEESQLAKMVQSAESVEGIQVVKHFSYPSGNETTYLTDVIAIQEGDTSWILLITSDYDDQNIEEVIEKVVKSLQLN